jgi:hypothetical protein
MQGQCMGSLPPLLQPTRHPEEEPEVATEVCAWAGWLANCGEQNCTISRQLMLASLAGHQRERVWRYDSMLGRKRVTPSPSNAVRTDQFGHWPVYKDKGRYRRWKAGFSIMHCSKCKVCLCFKGQRIALLNATMDYKHWQFTAKYPI